MEVNIRCQPSYSIAYLILEAEEKVQVERGAMVAMSGGIHVTSGVGQGGVVKAVMRKQFGGEHFFMGYYTAQVHHAWVAVAPPYPGDLAEIDVGAEGDVLVEQGSFLAAESDVAIDVKYGGMRSILLKEGISMLRIGGVGKALICSYGGLMNFRLAPGEHMIVDTGHLVAFSASMKPKIGLLSGVVTSSVTGEGLVADMEGPGLLFIQTRSEQALGDWLFPERSQNTRTQGE